MYPIKEDKTLLEVQEWKRSRNESVAHLPRREALSKRMEDALANARAMGCLQPEKSHSPADAPLGDGGATQSSG